MSSPVCRWGILGTATIARKNWQSIRNAGNATLNAVASRSVQRAQSFIDDCQSRVAFANPPRAYGSYEELLGDADVDAVYVPLPTGMRTEWVVRAAEAGKHVLVEKPCGVAAADVSRMLDACRQNNVQFMDGVMFMHSARLPAIRAILNSPQGVGRLRRMATNFSFLAPDDFMQENIRVSSELEPLGCLGDLGWYNIRFCLWVLNWQMPQRVTGRLLSTGGRPDSAQPVPTEFSGELFFEQGVSAAFYCSFLTEHQQWVNLSGTEGHLQLNDFVLPEYGSELRFDVCRPQFQIDSCQFNMEMHRRTHVIEEYSNNAVSAQEANMVRNFSQLVLSGKVDESWGQIALKTQQVMDACLNSARSGCVEVSLS